MPDCCNECGACCLHVRGVTDIWKQSGWLRPDGSCQFYNRWLRKCMVYEKRPWICRMDKTRPEHLSLEQWYDTMSEHCDKAHQIVFGVDREKREGGCLPKCEHHVPSLEIQVETSVVCNARCHFCPYKSGANDGRRGKFMDPSLFYKIVDEVETISAISQFALNGMGEPLLDPHIYDYIDYIHKKCPWMSTLLHTNGVHLDPERLHATGLTNLVVSLNAVNAQQHEEVMGLKGQFDKVCANIEKARTLPGWNVVVRAVYSQDHFTEEDYVKFHDRWGWKWGEEAISSYETNWIAHNRSQRLPTDDNVGCLRALTQIYIAYNGDVHMCCMDAFGRIVFGNVVDQTIREIYNSDKYVRFRSAHYEDRALDVPECSGCSRC